MWAQNPRHEYGGFSHLNAIVCVEKKQVLGTIISYAQPDPYGLATIIRLTNLLMHLPDDCSNVLRCALVHSRSQLAVFRKA